jgi:hypothetical protein
VAAEGDITVGIADFDFFKVKTEPQTVTIYKKAPKGGSVPPYTKNPEFTATAEDPDEPDEPDEPNEPDKTDEPNELGEPKLPFLDVQPDDWFCDAAAYVYFNDLMIGTADDAFDPHATLTRAMIVTILHRLAGEPDAAQMPNPFDDVPKGAWYAEAVNWGMKNGIALGYGNGKFGPNDPVTKEQLAAFVYRAQQSSAVVPPDILMDYEWRDWEFVSGWAKPAVAKLTMQGIFRDIPGADFRPQTPATRAETAAVFYRYLTASK